jgi:hydrogenase maturation factor
MGEKYNEGLVLRKIAECIGEHFSKASLYLPFAKGYKGRVKSVDGNTYTIEVDGVPHNVKSDYVLSTGEYVTLLSLQNQKGDYVIIPTAKQIKNSL